MTHSHYQITIMRRSVEKKQLTYINLGVVFSQFEGKKTNSFSNLLIFLMLRKEHSHLFNFFSRH